MIGATVPTIGGLDKAFDHADKWGCECFQIYLTASRRWASPPISDEQKRLFAEAWQKSDVKEVISHVPFLVNIASPDEELRTKSIDRLRVEVATAGELGARLLVLHPGSPRESDREEAKKHAIEAINLVLDGYSKEAPVILIETMAGQGTALGSYFEEIAELIDGVENKSLIGVCFDTAHVFAAGYDLSGPGGYEKVIGEFNSIVGVEKIGLFHINDSKTALGSHHDRHTYVGEGEIGLTAFHSLLRDPRFNAVPKVLELPGRGDSIKDNLSFLRRLALKHRPLAT